MVFIDFLSTSWTKTRATHGLHSPHGPHGLHSLLGLLGLHGLHGLHRFPQHILDQNKGNTCSYMAWAQGPQHSSCSSILPPNRGSKLLWDRGSHSFDAMSDPCCCNEPMEMIEKHKIFQSGYVGAGC